MAASYTVADITDGAVYTLNKFKRDKSGKEILIHVSDKPLLRHLLAAKKEYGSGLQYFEEPVQGALMADQPTFYTGIEQDDQVVFTSPGTATDTQYAFRWMAGNFQMTRDELLKAGIHITQGKTSKTADSVDILADLYESKVADYYESLNKARNEMLWGDGTSDAKAIAGLKSILSDDPTAGTTGGISRAGTNIWWRHIARTGVGGALPKVAYSKANQTLTQALDTDIRKASAYRGNPNVFLAGGDYVDAVKSEMRAAGQQTTTGWADSKTGILVKGIKVGAYEIEWDPTMDARGDAKRLYAFDSSKVILRPMKQEWDKMEVRPEPPDQFLLLITTTDRGTLSQCQPDACFVHELE